MAQSSLLPRLAAHLIEGTDPASQRTPSERELAEHFQIGRGQVREALAILEALDIVERRAKSGIFLTTRRAGVEALALLARAGLPLDRAEVLEAVELRKIHEIKAAELASERARPENLDRLDAALRASERRIAAGQGIHREDRDFHLEIVAATQNALFHRIVGIYYVISQARAPVYFADPARARRSHGEHVQIFDALVRRDGTLASALMNAHLSGVESYWMGLIGRADAEAPPEAAPVEA
jgi:DNA-binding FadR family transcriptional regulator